MKTWKLQSTVVLHSLSFDQVAALVAPLPLESVAQDGPAITLTFAEPVDPDAAQALLDGINTRLAGNLLTFA